MRIIRRRLKQIIKEEAQKLLREQARPLEDIQKDLDGKIETYNQLGQALGAGAHANQDFIDAGDAIETLRAEKETWRTSWTQGGKSEMSPEQVNAIQWQNFLEAYPPGSIVQGAKWDPDYKTALGKTDWPLRGGAGRWGGEPYSTDWYAYDDASKGWDLGHGSLVNTPAWAAKLGQYTDMKTGLPGIRESRINEASDALIQDLINLISDESIAMEAEQEMGPEAYADWLGAYKDPDHPYHDEAKLALPAIDPASPDFVYPAKKERLRAERAREWDRLTSGEEVVE